MSKPIKLTPELKQQAVQEFAKALSEMKMADGKLSYSKNFTYKNEEKAKILFTPIAYAKMVSLLMAFDTYYRLRRNRINSRRESCKVWTYETYSLRFRLCRTTQYRKSDVQANRYRQAQN